METTESLRSLPVKAPFPGLACIDLRQGYWRQSIHKQIGLGIGRYAYTCNVVKLRFGTTAYQTTSAYAVGLQSATLLTPYSYT